LIRPEPLALKVNHSVALGGALLYKAEAVMSWAEPFFVNGEVVLYPGGVEGKATIALLTVNVVLNTVVLTSCSTA